MCNTYRIFNNYDIVTHPNGGGNIDLRFVPKNTVIIESAVDQLKLKSIVNAAIWMSQHIQITHIESALKFLCGIQLTIISSMNLKKGDNDTKYIQLSIN